MGKTGILSLRMRQRIFKIFCVEEMLFSRADNDDVCIINVSKKANDLFVYTFLFLQCLLHYRRVTYTVCIWHIRVSNYLVFGEMLITSTNKELSMEKFKIELRFDWSSSTCIMPTTQNSAQGKFTVIGASSSFITSTNKNSAQGQY